MLYVLSVLHEMMGLAFFENLACFACFRKWRGWRASKNSVLDVFYKITCLACLASFTKCRAKKFLNCFLEYLFIIKLQAKACIFIKKRVLLRCVSVSFWTLLNSSFIDYLWVATTSIVKYLKTLTIITDFLNLFLNICIWTIWKLYLEHNFVWESCFREKYIHTWVKHSR